MNKLTYQNRSLSMPPASQPDLEPARRLIVLVPGPEADLTAIAQRVWELANATGAHVKFLSLYSDPMQEPGLRRRLATMSAIVNDGSVAVEAEVLFGKDWVDVVRSHQRAGDMVVCCAEHRAGLLQKPLSLTLQSDLDMPLYILFGLYPQNDLRSSWKTQTIAWIGFIVILFGFFVLQVKIDQFAKEGATILQILSAMIELWSILVWNNLFR